MNKRVPFTLMLILVVSNDFVWSDCVHSRPGIELSSSLDGSNRTAACPGETVVYTCTVANTGLLQWAVESFHRLEGDSILFTIQNDAVGTIVHQQGDLLIANVSHVTLNGGQWGNITSTLVIMAHDDFDNKRVWCGNGGVDEANSPCFLHQYGIPPSEPLYPFYTTTSHDTSSFSILLEWTRPQSDGGLGITNYTITLRVAYSVHTYVETSNKLHLTLLYNLIYAVEIVAANCAGYGRFNYLPSVHEVNCGLPDFPEVNMSNKRITSIPTHVGSTVQFLCVDNEEIITLECFDSGSWNPDPSEVQCPDIQQFDDAYCKTPVLPPRSNIDIERSVLGSVIVYQCDSGYEPTNLIVSKCSSVGEWSPNVTALDCTKPVDCGVPVRPFGALLHYTSTTENSTVVSVCDVGFIMEGKQSHSVSLCVDNGSWIPDTTVLRCIAIPAGSNECPSPPKISLYIYIIFGLTLFLTSLPLGICAWLRFRKKQKASQLDNTQYDVVKLKTEPVVMQNNDAYSVH